MFISFKIKKNLSTLRLSHEHAFWEQTNGACSPAGMTLRSVLSPCCWQTATVPVEDKTQAASPTTWIGGKTASEQHAVHVSTVCRVGPIPLEVWIQHPSFNLCPPQSLKYSYLKDAAWAKISTLNLRRFPKMKEENKKTKQTNVKAINQSSLLISWCVPAGCCYTETNTKRLQVDKPALPAVPTHTDNTSWKDKAFLECISGFHRWKKKERETGQSELWLDEPPLRSCISGTAAQFAPHIQRQTTSIGRQDEMANHANGTRKLHRINVNSGFDSAAAGSTGEAATQVRQPHRPRGETKTRFV